VTTSLPEARQRAALSPQQPIPNAISISHLCKNFRLPHERYHTLKQRALHPFRARSFELLRAVHDVSLDIPRGEFHGIVGRNGSGKSTLLKCLAGIYEADGGTIEVDGRLSPFIELGVGFTPELTGRENAVINAIMFGLSRRDAEARLPDIVEFAELEEFMDLKLKNYSSGMHVRLAFAVAIQVDAEILLIDEVLAVGDAAFQQKCYDEFARLKESGRTIVFVTHDMGAVKRFCDRATLLERGAVVATGEPGEIARKYNELNFTLDRKEALESHGPEALRRPPVAAIIDAGFETLDGKPVVSAQQGETCCVRAQIQFHAPAENPNFAVALVDEAGQIQFETNSELTVGASGSFSPGETAVVRVQFRNWLPPGRYRLVIVVMPERGSAVNAYDLREDISSLIVQTQRYGGGTTSLPHSLEIERG
jgi:ABC-type polysaccharide/polyol phosphate transport system ATPase subunit